jgi:hypothetical protein
LEDKQREQLSTFEKELALSNQRFDTLREHAESKLEELGELDYVGGYVSFKGSNIKSLNKLKKVVGFANFDTSMVEDLGNLESVGGNIYLLNSRIKSLGKLNYVGGMVMMDKNNYKGLEGNYDAISEQLKK